MSDSAPVEEREELKKLRAVVAEPSERKEMPVKRIFRLSDLDCGHRFLTAKYEYRKGGDGWPEFRCEECGDWSRGHTIETVSA